MSQAEILHALAHRRLTREEAVDLLAASAASLTRLASPDGVPSIIERLEADLQSARSAMIAAQNDRHRLERELRETRVTLALVIDHLGHGYVELANRTIAEAPLDVDIYVEDRVLDDTRVIAVRRTS